MSSKGRGDPSQFAWLDLIKALALGGIFLNHLTEMIFGIPHIANPRAGWAPFGERLAQLEPLTGHGFWNIPNNLFRWAGWFGEHGVSLFLIVGGFGLTWGLIARYGKGPLPLRDFYGRRMMRIYPLWWGAHLAFISLWFLTGLGMSLSDPATVWSILGIRVTPYSIYYFSPAWWYIGLLLQLYLVFPLLWEGLRRWGPTKLLIVCGGAALIVRGIGLLVFTNYLDAWMRGAVFITRLPEFLFGVSLAAWMYHRRERTEARLRLPSTIMGAVAACVLSFPLALTLLGMTIMPLLLGAGMLVLLYAGLGRIPNSGRGMVGVGTWIGRHSYALFLVHHPCLKLLIPEGPSVSAKRVLVGTILALIATVVSAVILEETVKRIQERLAQWRATAGTIGAGVRTAGIILATGLILAAGDLAVRRFAPQEALGWGERPSLEPDPAFGWKLIPSKTTRLRWASYDYIVTSNSLGFPGPEYPEAKAPGVPRILTLGDAFTSAEGVDTGQAWPRLLESELKKMSGGNRVDVLNFGITGYGPIQYARVFEKYGPVYKPDLLIIGFFVNEYQDVMMDVDKIRDSIGFKRPSPDSLLALIQFGHLRTFVNLELRQPMIELIMKRPRGNGYNLGNFASLEKSRPEIIEAGRRRVFECLEAIKKAADGIQAKVLIAMIPAPVQVAGRERLAYFPKPVDLSDKDRFDLDQPQRMTKEIADSLGLAYHDLRPALLAVKGGGAYQARNMHWTVAGHEAAAANLARLLSSASSLLPRR